MGWTVICLWQHQIELNIDLCIERISSAVQDNSTAEPRKHLK
jgi:very-short-patch-repair endonuclease